MATVGIDPVALCEGIAAAVESRTGLVTLPWEPGSIDPPLGVVYLGDPFIEEPHETMNRAVARLGLLVRIFGGTAAGVDVAMPALYQFLASGTSQQQSVIDALYADTTFGGIIHANQLRVQTVGGPKFVEMPSGVILVAADIPFQLTVERT